MNTNLWACKIIELQASVMQDVANTREICANQWKLDNGNNAITELEDLYTNITKCWSNIKFHCNIGYVQYATVVTVDIECGTQYMSDWAAFLAAELKVKARFEGNIVNLGAF
jgi:hypothetical protein